MIREYDRLNRFSVKLTCTLNTRDYNDQLSRYHTQTKQLNPTSNRSIFFSYHRLSIDIQMDDTLADDHKEGRKKDVRRI